MSETPENRLKRLRLRSWRRGMKEMDLILGRFADDRLGTLDPARLTTYDAMLEENDQELYRWVTGQAPVPDQYAPLMAEIAKHSGADRG
ncbi:hypothetical protein LCGC14_1313650 [marine sediment metagenome]|uniref:FAD assembly factor SdhE n=1 Tax=marine sediment metagenome TaxID=412755 RepID=A0A0F9KM62_9ZZZZ